VPWADVTSFLRSRHETDMPSAAAAIEENATARG
jgi:hypothetical protein